MRLVITMSFILLVMFSTAAYSELNNVSDSYENEPSIDTPMVEINEYSDEAESPAEGPRYGLDEEDSVETGTGDVIEAPPAETGEYKEEGEGFIEDSETETDEIPTSPEEEGFAEKPADVILEHFKRDENEGLALPSESPLDTPLDQESEPKQQTEPQESQDRKMTASEKMEKDQLELVKLNNEYEQINRKKEELDLEFKALEEEKRNLIKAKEALKNNEDVLEYNEKVKALNEKLRKYDEKQKVYDKDVKEFNERVKEDMERKIREAEARNVETNYAAFDETVDSSFEVSPYERLNIDKSAPIEEQRKKVLEYKARIEKEYQMLMKQRAEINKEKNLVKTMEDVNALNKKTSELNSRIVTFEKKRIMFDKDLNEFNSRLEAQFVDSAEETEEE